MISKLAQRTAYFFVTLETIKEEDLAIYKYGLELLFSLVINLVFVVAIALYFGKEIEITLFLLPYVVLRQLIGGYHARTHFVCTLLMIILLCTYIFFLDSILATLSSRFVVISMLSSFVLIYFLAPCEHPHKRILTMDVENLRRKAFIALFAFAVINTWLIVFQKGSYAVLISLGIATCTTVMVIGKLVYSKAHQVKI
ncbi:accessory gene regulator B family protein [Tyzzerella sp. OttesenSCG-928-J15]|nr:accessory gene regulator B family protein [Tyzzerella sp. OttesenSCG-928-J15]